MEKRTCKQVLSMAMDPTAWDIDKNATIALRITGYWNIAGQMPTAPQAQHQVGATLSSCGLLTNPSMS